MAFVVPGFTYRPVANRSAGIRTPTLGLILHVQAGGGSPFGWFDNTASQASSTWWVGKDGSGEQYVDPDTEHGWAQAAGNHDYHSVETEGQPGEPLTAAQVATLGRLFRAGHERWGWPLQLAEAPGQPGLGWHGMGGTAWGGHFGCPGDLRKAERKDILAAAGGSTVKDWFDMATEADLETALRNVLGLPAGQKVLSGADGNYIVKTIAYVRDQLMGQSAAIKDQIAKVNDPAAIAAAIPDSLAQAVVDALAARLKTGA